ncbi:MULTISPECIES: autotransporter outer membrane beta-barrel domain-containing protein [unclassified Brevundimonas]|uniref:autotransporter outer membrane beta-barrel domain-containing protein n=1 Tax=unclassified Brevundimonas TaxID=2622653 RepID=UPI000E8601BD|nr:MULTISPECIES: autotransporter outer membrane beta-barrel domain-containing protein [unclassified Brevundimonas]MCK6102982.1 autotransporter outer membrane beta-barrel domain-containing protein [Brevundimonas sp. EYE_349]HBI18283.1 autotransporter outer membrane beta-barrel domain-containing protein [Brevundimonas sp.]
MRILLASAVAIAPLMVATGSQAEIVISNARTTPIQTSNATGTGPDNIRLASGGSVAVTSGAAVTLNSNHTVDLDSGSSITMDKSADGSTGLLVNGGNTGSVIVGGAITVNDTQEAADVKDVDGDGDLDGPFATGTGRYGVRVVGPAPFTGNVLVESTGAITVEGNNSYGLAVETGLNGKLQSLGTIRVTGDNTAGIRTTGPVSGNVELSGSISALGANATGVSIEGDVGGAVKIHSSVVATGYRYTTPPPARPATGAFDNASTLFLDELDADDLLQGGPAVRIGASVAGGVLLDKALAYSAAGIEGDDDGDGVKNGDEDDDGDGIKNRDDPDRNGNGIPDASETTASITSLGGAPALLVGSTTQAVNLGAVGTGDAAYGLINRGSITASGLYSGVESRAVQLGVTGGQAVNVAGGVRNEGGVSSTAVDASATGLWIGSGVTAPAIVNTGAIQAVASGKETQSATGILIGAGANVGSLTNTGNLVASFGGNQGSAVVIRDQSGALTQLNNAGSIIGSLTPNTADTNPVTGTVTAIDLSANTSGVTLRQYGIPAPAGSTAVDTDKDGVPDANEPAIVGAIKLGSGADTLNIENGVVNGDIDFGAGADKLNISGGAVVTGAIKNGDNLLDINIGKGTLNATQTGAVGISSLNVGAEGSLLVNLDPANDRAGGFNVSGNATLATGSKLGVRFSSLLDGPERFNIITAGSLNVGQINQSQLTDNSPYLYVVEAGVNQAANTVYVDARRRTAAEASLIPVEASAYDAVYAALGSNETVRNLFLSQTTRDGFIDAYEQMLPDHSGGPLMSLSAGVDAVTRALTGRNAVAAPGETSAWVQEINFYADKDKTDSYGFRSEGFGVAGGVEKGTSVGAVGISAAFTSSDIKDPESEAEEVLSANLLELGLYWRAQGQYWTTWARAAGGYASFNADRSLVASGVYLNNKSDWHGWTAAVAGGASYERNFGRLNVRPEIYGEYFRLSEGARSESGGGDGFDLDIDSRDSHIFSAVAAMNIGYGFGRNGWIRPELRVGYRQNISVDAGETIARFASGGPDFILSPDAIEGGGPILGFRLNFGNELGMLSLTGDAELLEDYVRYSLLLRASFRF